MEWGICGTTGGLPDPLLLDQLQDMLTPTASWLRKPCDPPQKHSFLLPDPEAPQITTSPWEVSPTEIRPSKDGCQQQ